MKNILTILILLLKLNCIGQTYPINEPFNSVAAWTCTNGSGLQTYGGGLNYLTTNIGTTPYPNGSTITMTSPAYSFTNCLANLTVTFPINGRIENGFDFMSFQYFNAGAWVNVATHTGVRNNVLYSYIIPNTVTRFRFRLITDATINSYGFPFTNVYYYDIDYFNITCSSVLPIELLYFSGAQKSCKQNILSWATATETNNDHFEIERSLDAINFETIKKILGATNSLETKQYTYIDFNPELGINYYRLKQVDINGEFTYAPIIDIDNSCIMNLKIIKLTNLLGQEVNDEYGGPKIIYYNDGSILKSL